MIKKIYHQVISNKISLIIYLLISIFITTISVYSVERFEENNLPVYDGVMYDFQQIRRYEKFHGDFSIRSRFEQAKNEFSGNNVSGFYSAVITFLSPTLLITKYDIFIRSFLGVFLFFISYHLFFKDTFHKKWIVFSLILYFHFPLFYNFRIGLGSSVPELVASIYLFSGVLFLLSTLKYYNLYYFNLGLISLFLSVLFRFNFFVYVLLILFPLLIIYLFRLKYFPKQKRIQLIFFLTFFFVSLVLYISLYFKAFINYYTNSSYAFSTLKLSISFMLNDFNSFLGGYGLLMLVIIILGNSIYRLEKPSPYFRKLSYLISIPFIVFFSFIVLYLKSTNTPHVFSIMTLFFIFIFSIFHWKLKVRPLTAKFFNINTVFFLLISVIINYFYFVNNKHNNSETNAQNRIVSYLEHKLNHQSNLKIY